ncbi:cobalamin-5'-phosphate synthase [Halopenitus malekzadehii]|uniref:Adenosylcobinamide-GDP ribazoletransferase n=1 Tax=Halopenitus malekzadehii TaxID=1267564 RepID=A0A1H6HUF7_9EURY|nr:adenosylcobinamide-GDP ribazoletransferase [Halopenitus malekzadehii]SEH37757.1 cobalamin-5'-phosphate synthase [Halopenitus malekzadehii]
MTSSTRGPIRRRIGAVRGAVTFLTRLPISGGRRSDWDDFRTSPWTIPVVGWVIGIALAAFVLSAGLASIPWPTIVAGYLCLLYALSGVTHADGVADLGDAVAAHDPDRRRAVLADADLGVGGVLLLGVTLLVTTLGAAAIALPTMNPLVAAGIILAAEVGAKLGMALAVCFGTAAHEGLGSGLADPATPADSLPVVTVALPAVVIALPVLFDVPAGTLLAVLAALCAGPAVALVVVHRTRSWLGGVSGDVFGAINEVGRALALHAGVIAWAIV